MSNDHNFQIGDKVVYASHGVGEIQNIKVSNLQGTDVKVYIVSFSENSMVLHIPSKKSELLRSLVSKEELENAYDTLRMKPKSMPRMSTKKNYEIETKLKSGDLSLVAEVLRDLYKLRIMGKDPSYSERTAYETSLNRLASEIAEIENISYSNAEQRVLNILKESQGEIA